ncbi:hypothetical protein ANN_04617 [Periplaneta americana]|uniref:Uncharacterized protein n=1 Tax=Periplaneta americana TaxID=6978 RepID=A0ABQ8TAH7_PERAM|nr:hypothetical protein ANN_04617 [Periplaneta americana]
MLNRSWTDMDQELRHSVISRTVDGYHHNLCKSKIYHDPNLECRPICELCDLTCDRYHTTQCMKLYKSIIEYSKN